MNKWAVPRFSAAEMLFSVKCFAASVLAVFVANWVGLPRPFWAMLTAYIVANPLAGAVRSKALFRFLGTLIGSFVAVGMVPALSNAPELLTLALAAWVATCLYLSLLDRTPRAYLFMLAGYTAALIGFPSVEAPLNIFDTAVARVEEIGLGILSATIVHSIVLPVGLRPTIIGMLDRAVGDAHAWFSSLLQPASVDQGGGRHDAERRKLAADITQLRLLSTHVPFDTTNLRWTSNALRSMQDGFAALTPAFSSVEDRLLALQAVEGTIADDVKQLLAEVDRWLAARSELGSPRDATADQREWETLRASIRALGESGAASPWARALRIALAIRLEQLVEGWRNCNQLRRDIDRGLAGHAVPDRGLTPLGNRTLHRDPGMALLSGFAAVLAIMACSAFWILTGWPSGSTATMMAAVFCSFFATADDPVPMIRGFLDYTLLSLPIAAIYVLVLMPLVIDIPSLVLVTAPVLLILGCFMARPATTAQSLALLLGVLGALALHDTASDDLASFINSNTGQVLGVLTAALVTGLVRSVGADWTARRIQRAIWHDLGQLAGARRARVDGQAFAVRALDRIGLLAPRIAQSAGRAEAIVADDALRDLRVGIDIVSLQQARATMPAGPIARGLADLATLFQARGRGRIAARPERLLPQLDAAIASALQMPTQSDDSRLVIASLVGLRRNLFPDAAGALA
ncbi:FUSC family protein [soil metagenome]